jgi:hypothetical protein
VLDPSAFAEDGGDRPGVAIQRTSASFSAMRRSLRTLFGSFLLTGSASQFAIDQQIAFRPAAGLAGCADLKTSRQCLWLLRLRYTIYAAGRQPLLLAHPVNSRQCGTSAGFGTKRTLTEPR